VKSVLITPRAASDLAAIARYGLETWGEDRTSTYLRRLDARFTWLAIDSNAGRPREDVAPGYRCFAEGNHLIFYIIRPDAIAIIGVPHQAMDIGPYFA
jgi:toxin ParE1/3/4